MYVLMRDDGYFVARLGYPSSYTKDIYSVRTFATRESAARDKCGNETIVSLYDLMG